MSSEDEETQLQQQQKLNGGVWFYVNRTGFPMDDATWGRMWDYAAKIHPSGCAIQTGIRSQRTLPALAVPHAPLSFAVSVTIPNRLTSIQKYLKQLQYNHTGTQFFDIKKNRPICGLMDCARDMICASLPIKCLEAVVLAVYLTNYFPGLDRFPISFRSICHGNIHRHVVLALHHNGQYGCIGMSRRDDLMHKSIAFERLSDMIMDFISCYKKYDHDLEKVKIGATIPHDPHSYESIQWKALTLSVKKQNANELTKEIDRFARELRRQNPRWLSASNIHALQKLRNLSPKRSQNTQGSQSAEAIRKDKTEDRLMRDRRVLAMAVNSSNRLSSHGSSSSSSNLRINRVVHGRGVESAAEVSPDL